MNPSGLLNVRGCTNPAAVCDFNFRLIASHLSLTLDRILNTDPYDIDPGNAPGIAQSNFDAIAAALPGYATSGYVFLPVQTSDGPEMAVQYNFEIVNALW